MQNYQFDYMNEFLLLGILCMCKLWRITHKMSKAQSALCKVCE